MKGRAGRGKQRRRKDGKGEEKVGKGEIKAPPSPRMRGRFGIAKAPKAVSKAARPTGDIPVDFLRIDNIGPQDGRRFGIAIEA